MLSHLLGTGEVLSGSSYTVGCTTEVKVLCHPSGPEAFKHATAAPGSPPCQKKAHEFNGKQCFVELWDLGGSKKYAESRSLFFNHLAIHGLILVHDLTNRKSYKNLGRWIKEVIGSDSFKWKVDTEEGGGLASLKGKHTLELETYDGPLPVLIVGTMADLAAREQRSYQIKAIPSQPEVVERHSIEVNCMDASAFGEGTYSLKRLGAFLDQVCTRYYERPTNRKGPHRPYVQIDMSRIREVPAEGEI